MKKKLFLIFILTLILNPFIASAMDSPDANKAIDFTLYDINGGSVTLSDLEGKVVILDFWAIWCPYCVASMPKLDKLYSEYKDKDVVVLGIDFKESQKEVKAFINKEGIGYTILLDTDGQVAEKYNVRGFPTYLILDREHNVIFKGHALPQNITDVLDALLAGSEIAR